MDPTLQALAALDQAAFANGTSVHVQDFVDTYLSPSGEVCHPADALSGLLALAEHEDASVDRLLDLTPKETSHAISLATIPNAALRQTRVGTISMWKSSAPANAVRNALHAVELARRGFEGPSQPFAGRNGFEAQVAGALDTDALTPRGEAPAIGRTHITSWPAQFNTQTGIEAALDLRGRIAQLDQLESIRITTSDVGHALSADTPQKWAPTTREPADHSLPYLVVSALIDGGVTHGSFAPERLQEARRHDLLARVEVDLDDSLSAAYPEQLTVRVETEAMDGQFLRRTVDLPPGHANRPLSDGQLAAKVQQRLAPLLERHAADDHIDLVLNLAGDASAGQLLRHLATADGDHAEGP